ncbi:hypothetical protein GH714_014274 [Hevea brasiliensis]|uniref:glucan endo-1,3-beta-D-glucosidase n=1 Tax=Hevea brasiliensis TaxID=3981 RepID=A0A6A6KK23_HEVBR|nr:hypothetical protein GH714_014274 [Hevea brasiliensis]
MSAFKAAFLCLVVVSGSCLVAESAIGVNWGTLSFRKLNPFTVVDMLKGNKIEKVKLFDADPDVLRALMGSGIQVMVGIPNEMLAAISFSTAVSDLWVRQNVSRYVVKGGVDVSTDFPQDYAFFEGSAHPVTDGPNVYYNAFDGNFDTLVAALNKLGYGQMPIVIGEVGWPTDGAISANLTAARAFNQGLINHVLSNKGTPLRPDCTTLNYGGSCNGIGAKGNISYAFNSYYQLQDQNPQSCDFDGLGMVTFRDPSVGDCRFLIGVTDTSSSGFGPCPRFMLYVRASCRRQYKPMCLEPFNLEIILTIVLILPYGCDL